MILVPTLNYFKPPPLYAAQLVADTKSEATQFCEANITFPERAFPYKRSRKLALPLTRLMSPNGTTRSDRTPNLFVYQM